MNVLRRARPIVRGTLLGTALSAVVALGACGRAPVPQRPELPATAARTAAVLTTDCGVEVDDQWALVHLLLSAEIDLLAVVTTHAASVGFSSDASAREAAAVVARAQPGSAPRVVAGLADPLDERSAAVGPAPGVDLLLRLSRGFEPSRRLVVFVTGAATDVAAALARDPSFAERIAIVAMGFDDWPSGGDVFNVRNDPAAWRIVLDSAAPVVIGSSAVTQRGLRLTRAEARALVHGRGALGDYLFALFERWITDQAPLVARMVAPDTWVIWDEVVVAFALGMARGEEVPRPKLGPDLLFAHPPTERRITWVTGIDTRRVWGDFAGKLDAHSAKPSAASARPD